MNSGDRNDIAARHLAEYAVKHLKHRCNAPRFVVGNFRTGRKGFLARPAKDNDITAAHHAREHNVKSLQHLDIHHIERRAVEQNRRHAIFNTGANVSVQAHAFDVIGCRTPP